MPKGWTVKSLLLDGHIGTVRGFSKASMRLWKSQVHRAYKRLKADHDKVIIAAHSMGTLFAVREAVKDPAAALFLMNVPLKIGLKPILLKIVWSIYTNSVDPADKLISASKHSYGLEPDLNILHYLGWIPIYLELFDEISKTRGLAEKLNVPTIAYFSKNDEMVSVRSAAFLRNNPKVVLKLLKNSWHHYYSPEDMLKMQKDFYNLLRK